MHIALVVPGGVDRSGEYRVIPALLALIERLSLRHEVQVFALNQETQPGSWELAGATIHNIGERRTLVRAIRMIRAYHRIRPFDLIHSIWSGPCSVAAVVVAQMAGIPSVVHIGGGELAAVPEIQYGGALSWRGRLREALILRAASAVTAASEPTIETLSGLGIKAQCIPLGVDLNAWPPREPVRRDQGATARLIHVASLNRVKDQTTLLRALEALERRGIDFEMTVIGEDTLGGQIQSMAGLLGLTAKIVFCGFLPQRRLLPLVESAHLMILSSRHETGPVAMLEAAAVGVPTVGTAVGHIAEWAPSAALSVPVGDWAGLAEAIRELLSDEEQRLRIALQAKRRALSKDADYTAREFQALYERLARAA